MSNGDILTKLQFTVVACLGSDQLSGEELREKLRAAGVFRTGAGFYQMMGRLEESELVDGEYAKIEIGRREYRERRYRASGQGRRALIRTAQFYKRPKSWLKGLLHA